MNNTLAVYCLGPEFSNGHLAALKALPYLEKCFPGIEFEIRFAKNNADILDQACAANAVAIVPFENGVEGTVKDIMTWRRDNPSGALRIVGELRLTIDHQLLTMHDVAKNEITHCYSHPQALGQCRNNLQKLGVKPMPVEGTSLAAEKVGSGEFGRNAAAIANSEAGKRYGLVSHGSIGDKENNQTLFHICGPWHMSPTGNDATVFMFDVPDRPGGLCEVIEVFAGFRVNLRFIRPVDTGILGEVKFYVDAEMHMDTPEGRLIVSELEKVTHDLRVLGSFPASDAEPKKVSNLQKKRIGIIGMGVIGQAMHAFFNMRGMDVVTYDKKHQNGTSLGLIAARSDVIILAVPATEVDSVLREIVPLVRDDQGVINLCSVMHHHSCGKAAYAQIHFMSSPRGLSFGKRAAYVYMDTEQMHENARWILDWVQQLVIELDAVYVSTTVCDHNNMRVPEQVLFVISKFLHARILKRYMCDLGTLLSGGSPATESELAMLSKVLLHGEMYAGIAEENPGTPSLIFCMIEELVRMHDDYFTETGGSRITLSEEFAELKGSHDQNLLRALAAKADKALADIGHIRP